jgi:acetolactate synthase-1/2/3 large subunit
MTGGEALVAALAAHEVSTVFGIPGTHNLGIYAHLSSYRIRHFSPRHEQGAGYAADGYARVTGRPGVCLTTSGPAVLNAAAAVAQAYSDSVPVLVISPGLPLGHPGLGNGYLHEVKDQSRAMDALVSYSHRVTSVEEIPLAVAQAFASMGTGRPRPVHLEIPLDLIDLAAEVEAIAPVKTGVGSPDADSLSLAGRLLSGAERPGIIVGGGCRGAADQLRSLCESTGAPVVTTTNGKGVLPEDHPLSLGAGVHLPSVQRFLDDCDVVLAVGTELAPSDWWFSPPVVNGKLIRVDVDAAQVLTNAVPDVALVGDAAVCLAELDSRIHATPRQRDELVGTEQEEASLRADRWRERIREEARSDGAPWLGLMTALSGTLSREAIVAGDSAMVAYYGAMTSLPRYVPSTFLYPTGLGTLGYGVPAAIGAKLGRPETPVLALMGDGGLMFTVAELAGAAEAGLAIPVVVVDNAGYGEIRREMVDRGDELVGVDLGRPDFVALAQGLGCRGVSVASVEELTHELAKAFDADRPTLIHIPEMWCGLDPQRSPSDAAERR